MTLFNARVQRMCSYRLAIGQVERLIVENTRLSILATLVVARTVGAAID